MSKSVFQNGVRIVPLCTIRTYYINYIIVWKLTLTLIFRSQANNLAILKKQTQDKKDNAPGTTRKQRFVCSHYNIFSKCIKEKVV